MKEVVGKELMSLEEVNESILTELDYLDVAEEAIEVPDIEVLSPRVQVIKDFTLKSVDEKKAVVSTEQYKKWTKLIGSHNEPTLL